MAVDDFFLTLARVFIYFRAWLRSQTLQPCLKEFLANSMYSESPNRRGGAYGSFSIRRFMESTNFFLNRSVENRNWVGAYECQGPSGLYNSFEFE